MRISAKCTRKCYTSFLATYVVKSTTEYVPYACAV